MLLMTIPITMPAPTSRNPVLTTISRTSPGFARCYQGVAAEQKLFYFIPIDFAGVEAERHPSARCDVGGKIEPAGLGLGQPLVVVGQHLAGDGDNSVSVMVVEKVGEGLFSDQELGVRSVHFARCLRKG